MAPTLWPSGDGMNTGVPSSRSKRSANCMLSAASESSQWLTALGGPVVLEVNMRCAVVPGTSAVTAGAIGGPSGANRSPVATATGTGPRVVVEAARRMASAGRLFGPWPPQMTSAGRVSSKM